jgi:hypothetical protein
MSSRPVKEQIFSGFAIAAKTLLVIATGGALAGGLAVIRKPEATLPYSFVGRHPLTPWVCVIIASLILVSDDRSLENHPSRHSWLCNFGWADYAYKWQVRKNGRYPTDSSCPYALYIAATWLTSSFARRPLTLIDLVALMGFVFCLAFSMSPSMLTTSTALGVGSVLLLIAWAIDRIPKRGGHSFQHRPPSSSHDNPGRT